MKKQIKISELLPKAFHSVWRASLNSDILHVVTKGGRGSGKSSDIAHIIIQLMMRYPVNAVAIRKVDNTLEQSVFEQLKWAINEQYVTHLWKVNKSPLKLTYLPTGNYIVFRGAQEPERIKSLKDSKFPFAIAWIEELAEFKTEDEVKTITNSLLRGELDDGLFYKFFYSYNPPKRRSSWVNKKYETVTLPQNTYVHHSTYLDNPYISKEFIEEAKSTKERNERSFKWEYMGEAIGSGIAPFENLEFKTINEDEMKAFDNIRCGLDFGFANDEAAFVVWHYDKKRRTIYALHEIYGLKISNRMMAEYITKLGYHDEYILADSAEPKSIAELKNEYDMKRIKGAKKGKDWRTFSTNWLDDLDAIIIDPKRTPNIAREFESIDYEIDRDGNPKNKLADGNDNSIDATKYALSQDMEKQTKWLV